MTNPDRTQSNPVPQAGQVEAIFIHAEAGEMGRSVEEADIQAGQGVVGDRYHRGEGTFSDRRGPGRDLTLIEAEAIEGMAADGIEIEPAEARRNVLTRGVDLNALVGMRFRVGEVECRGDRLCDPCSHLESVTKPGVLKGLVNRGGLRADVLEGGTIRPGDPVEPIQA
jgi:MOSC domain-containing protein YiiM